MIITRIVVDGVGKFGKRSEIVGLGEGVNILAAGNEFGKSTIFKAVRACLFERHNTKNEDVRNLASEGLSLPVTVTIGFDHEGASYTLTKSFIKSASASLMRGATEIARNREADEKAWELLGIAPGSGRSVDEAAFALLWVGQGQSFAKPKPTEAATSALNAAIQSEVGALVGGERARAVLGQVKTELATLLTDSGKPKSGGPLHAAVGQAETLEADLSAAEVKLALLDQQLNDLASKRGERQRLSDPAELSRLQGELKAAEREAKEAQDAAAIVATLEADERHEMVLAEKAERDRADLIACRDAIDTDRERGFELANSLDPIVVQKKAAQEAAQQARGDIGALDIDAEKDEGQERALQRLAKCVARSEARPGLDQRLKAMEAFESRLRENKAALAGNAVTAASIASLDKIERELAVIAARLEAAAPEVVVEVSDSGAGKVRIDSAIISGRAMQAAVDPLTIVVGDLATVRVSPPAGAQKGDLDKRANLQGQLSKLLSDAGVGTAPELRAARVRRQELESESASLQAEAKALGVEQASVAVEIERLKTELTEIDQLVATELERSDVSTLPTSDEITRSQDDLRTRREEGRRKRKALEGTLEAQNSILSALSAELAGIEARQSEIQVRLQANLVRLPDQDRPRLIGSAEDAAAAARDRHRSKALALEEQRKKTPSQEEMERRANRVDRLKRALLAQNERLGDLEKNIANLEGQIQSAGGDGLGERVETLREEFALAQRVAERQEARAESLSLLRETIEACYKEQRDRLNAPLRRHLQPFLNDVFPSAELELGDGFAITGIKRNGPAAEDFERLSAGTQEQIAVLVRLAMGAMLGERGQPVPIILDDALVFSDDDRIEQMFDALTRAGQKQQVIVLTCRTRAFAALGGRPLAIAH